MHITTLAIIATIAVVVVCNQPRNQPTSSMEPVLESYEKPLFFQVKKWLLIILSVLNVVLMIIYASLSDLLSKRYLYDFESFIPYHIEETKSLIIITLVTISIFSIAFSILGIIGAFKENLTVTAIYAILCILNLGITIANAVKRPYYSAAPIWALLTTLSAVVFTYDLYSVYKIKQQKFKQHGENV